MMTGRAVNGESGERAGNAIKQGLFQADRTQGSTRQTHVNDGPVEIDFNAD